MKQTCNLFAVAICAVLLIGLSPSIGREGGNRSGRSTSSPLHTLTSAISSDVRATAALMLQPKAAQAYGELPLSFEANRGQTDSRVKFLSRGRGYGLFLTSAEAILALGHATEADVSGPASSRNQASGRVNPVRTEQDSAPQQRAVLRISLAGAKRAASVTGLDELPGEGNLFPGRRSEKMAQRRWKFLLRRAKRDTCGHVHHDSYRHIRQSDSHC